VRGVVEETLTNPEKAAALIAHCLREAVVVSVEARGEQIVILFDCGYEMACGAGYNLRHVDDPPRFAARVEGPKV
jgi:hypothetical protein